MSHSVQIILCHAMSVAGDLPGNASSSVVNNVLLVHEQQSLPALLPKHACQAHHSWACAANLELLLLLLVHLAKRVLLV